MTAVGCAAKRRRPSNPEARVACPRPFARHGEVASREPPSHHLLRPRGLTQRKRGSRQRLRVRPDLRPGPARKRSLGAARHPDPRRRTETLTRGEPRRHRCRRAPRSQVQGAASGGQPRSRLRTVGRAGFDGDRFRCRASSPAPHLQAVHSVVANVAADRRRRSARVACAGSSRAGLRGPQSASRDSGRVP